MKFKIRFEVWGMQKDDAVYTQTVEEVFEKNSIEEAKQFVLDKFMEFDEFKVFNEDDELLFDDSILE